MYSPHHLPASAFERPVRIEGPNGASYRTEIAVEYCLDNDQFRMKNIADIFRSVKFSEALEVAETLLHAYGASPDGEMYREIKSLWPIGMGEPNPDEWRQPCGNAMCSRFRECPSYGCFNPLGPDSGIIDGDRYCADCCANEAEVAGREERLQNRELLARGGGDL